MELRRPAKVKDLKCQGRRQLGAVISKDIQRMLLGCAAECWSVRACQEIPKAEERATATEDGDPHQHSHDAAESVEFFLNQKISHFPEVLCIPFKTEKQKSLYIYKNSFKQLDFEN